MQIETFDQIKGGISAFYLFLFSAFRRSQAKRTMKWCFIVATPPAKATDFTAELLKSLNQYSNIQIHFEYDICDYTTVSNPYRITSVTIKPVNAAQNDKNPTE